MRADHFSADVRELIETLARHAVRFLLVGGEAVIYHGYPRLTGDVDFWYEQSPDNVPRLFAALSEFWDGTIPGGTTQADLAEPDIVVQFGRVPNRVDMISAIDGVTFVEAWPRRVEEMLERHDGPPTPLAVLGLEDLIRNKRAAARHKDLDDLEHLERPARKQGR